MPSKVESASTKDQSRGTKRKEAPNVSNNDRSAHPKRRDTHKRVKLLDARSILAQKPDAALKDGDLDIQAFLKSREFEIKALQDGMERSKSSRTTRAFQQVPRDLRRRTASHNVKRVPKRLHKRAQREMREDNTPTVDPSRRKPRSTRQRIRAETAKRLGILAEKKRKQKQSTDVETRPARPKIRRDKLNDPPEPKAKYRKRQINKTWLPTHMWHAKRATMTEPKNPLWRFALPMTSTEKSYRPTHRAGGARGCVAWDMSYMSTISMEGNELGLMKVLKGLGVVDKVMWEKKGQKWRDGKRSWTGWLSRDVDGRHIKIAPATVIWCATQPLPISENASVQLQKESKRRLFIRVHPAAFLETWEEVLRLSKSQRPAVHVEDLRYEIGSIEITGPGSTETLHTLLHPFVSKAGTIDSHAQVFATLAGLTNPSSLPANSLLSFNILDPRLHYPPRPAKLPSPTDERLQLNLLETICAWPADSCLPSSTLFDREKRYQATLLPSQKALNRRKSLAPPGEHPSITSEDPAVPLILLASKESSGGSAQGTWTILAPWKCILPLWHGVVHCPLTTGGNPRFGGLHELRQLHFERGVPWFPADFPGTAAGFAWEEEQRAIKKAEWERRPKGKRVEWDSLDLGAGRKGEVGRGWACDFEKILELNEEDSDISMVDLTTQDTTTTTRPSLPPVPSTTEQKFVQLLPQAFEVLLSNISLPLPPLSTLSTIRITLISRGVATQNARIYRLPASSPPSPDTLSTPSHPRKNAQAWRSLLTPNPQVANSTQKHSRLPLNVPLSKRVRLMAKQLLEASPHLTTEADKEGAYPLVPDVEDLIGFVTTGAFNLAEGKGSAIGSICVRKILEGRGDKERERTATGRLCIVRNAGEKMGRLARWEAV